MKITFTAGFFQKGESTRKSAHLHPIESRCLRTPPRGTGCPGIGRLTSGRDAVAGARRRGRQETGGEKRGRL